MDTLVTIKFTDTLQELEDKKELFNSLTYRERKFSDQKQIEDTGMSVSDFYNFMIDRINDLPTKEEPIDNSLEDEPITEDLDLVNKYNKTKFNSNLLDKQIDNNKKELEKAKKAKTNNKVPTRAIPSVLKLKSKEKGIDDYIYDLQDNISYLNTLKKLNEKENTTVDNIMIMQFNTLSKFRVSKEDKLKLADSIIENCQEIIQAYDISISYMYGDESKMEEGLKKISNISLNKIGSFIFGPINSILDYLIKRSTNSIMIRVRRSANPKSDMIKYRDKMENTKAVLLEKRKVIERKYKVEN